MSKEIKYARVKVGDKILDQVLNQNIKGRPKECPKPDYETIKKIRWETSEDERVRASHAKLDGKVFDWDDLPVVDGVKTSPGRPINCRCVAVPIIKI